MEEMSERAASEKQKGTTPQTRDESPEMSPLQYFAPAMKE